MYLVDRAPWLELEASMTHFGHTWSACAPSLPLVLRVQRTLAKPVQGNAGLMASAELRSSGVISMNSIPVPKRPIRSPYPDPAPADYTDEVSDTAFNALKEALASEFEHEEFELVSGPAW